VLFGPDWATTYLPVSTKWSVGQAERFMYAHFMALWMEDEAARKSKRSKA
jgi:hypothetical protein